MPSGIYKQVSYKKEVTYGVAPGAASAQLLRRVTSSLDMQKDTYVSNEIRPDFQVADFRHGIRKPAGTIAGELSPKTYADFIAAALKKLFTATAAITGLTITITGVPGAYVLTRTTGSWLTDGVKIGDIGRLTAGSFTAANLNKNLMATNVTALALTVLVLNASTLTLEGPIATSTFAVTGKKSLIPQTGHTDESFSIEHWNPDVPASEVFTGQKPSKISLQLPPTGMATISIDFAGKDATPSAAQYFTSPTAITTTGNLAAVNGVIRVAGATAANITGLTLDISAKQSGEPTVGSNTISTQAPGTVMVTGQVTAVFDSTALRDAFYNETEIALNAVFTSDNTASSEFVAVSMSRIKIGGNSKDDGDKTLIVTCPFQALLNIAGGAALANDMTTVSFQDSAA